MNAQKLIDKLIEYSNECGCWDALVILSKDRLPLANYVSYDEILDTAYEILFALSKIIQKENNYKFSIRDKVTKAYSYNVKADQLLRAPVHMYRLHPIFMTPHELEFAVNIYKHIMYGEELDEPED